MTVTVTALAARVQTLIEQLTAIQNTIIGGVGITPTSVVGNLQLIGKDMQNQLRTLKDQQLTADVQFREAEATAQATGYKTIHQNLQEFVLTFFFISYLIFTITLIIYNYTETGQLGSAILKIGGMMGVSLLCIAAIIIRYA